MAFLTHLTFLDTVAVNFFSFVSMQKIHIRSSFEFLCYNGPRNLTFFDIVTVKFCSFANVQEKLPSSSCRVIYKRCYI